MLPYLTPVLRGKLHESTDPHFIIVLNLEYGQIKI